MSARARKAAAQAERKREAQVLAEMEPDPRMREIWCESFDTDFGDRIVAQNYRSGFWVSTVRLPYSSSPPLYAGYKGPVFETMVFEKDLGLARAQNFSRRRAWQEHRRALSMIRSFRSQPRSYTYRKRR